MYQLPAQQGSRYPCLPCFLKPTPDIHKVTPWPAATYHGLLCVSLQQSCKRPGKALARITDNGPRLCFRTDLFHHSSSCSEIPGQIFPKGKSSTLIGCFSKNHQNNLASLLSFDPTKNVLKSTHLAPPFFFFLSDCSSKGFQIYAEQKRQEWASLSFSLILEELLLAFHC